MTRRHIEAKEKTVGWHYRLLIKPKISWMSTVALCWIVLVSALSFSSTAIWASDPPPGLPPGAAVPYAPPHANAPTLIEHDPASGLIIRVLEARGDFRYRHDADGRLLMASQQGDNSVRLTYDQSGRVTRLSLHASDDTLLESLQIDHDADGRMIRQVLLGNGEIRTRRDESGKITDWDGDLDETGRRTIFGLYGRLQMLKLPAEQAQSHLGSPSH